VIHIKIAGPRGCGRTTRACQLFLKHASEGRHVLVENPGHQWLNSMPERRMSQADVLITVHQADGDLTETTTP
jgi:hypothetical protein